ncbi:MAG: hypothetical protein RSA08_04375 [Clostridia bacterium]
MNGKVFKKGNIEIIALTFFVLVILIIIFLFFSLYIQINSFIYPIKQDLFYIVQNAAISMNEKELSYYNYLVDENTLKKKIEKIIEKNYGAKVKLSEISYDKQDNKVNIEVYVIVDPIVLNKVIKPFKLKIKDEVKLKLLEIK